METRAHRRGGSLARGLVALPLLLSSGCLALNLEWVAPEESASEGSGDSVSASSSASSEATVTGTSAGGESEGSLATSAASSTVGTGGVTSVGTAGETSDDGGCAPLEVELEILPPDIMFILDKSAAMQGGYFPVTEDPMDDQFVLHWYSVRAAVLAKASALGQWARMGFVLAPELGAPGEGAEACGVQPDPEAPLMLNAYNSFDSALPFDPSEMGGGRPLAEAIESAKEALWASPANGDAMQFIVIITSGAPNCDTDDGVDPYALFETYDSDAEQQLLEGYDDHMFSMVIGLSILEDLPPEPGDMEPDVDVWDALHELALAGGMADIDSYPAFKRADSEQGLYKKLELLNDLPFCVTTLPPELWGMTLAEFDASVDVELDGEALDRLEVCDDNMHGFILPDENSKGVIVVCGLACQELREANSNGEPADDKQMTIYADCP